MTSLIRSSITGLYHPKRSFDIIDSSSSKRTTSTIDRLLNADKSGFLPSTDSSINSSESVDQIKSSCLERTILEVQIKQLTACIETLQATIKRIRTESEYSIEDLSKKNQTLQHSLQQAQNKISELENQLDKSKQTMINLSDKKTPISVYQQQIKTLENDKLELKLQFQQYQHLHTKQMTQLEQTINKLKYQLTETNNKLRLNQFDQNKFENLNKNMSSQLHEQSIQIEEFQKRIIELELILSTLNSSNIINQTLLADIKQANDIRYENDQLKKQIELLKLKCNERIGYEEELRTLRQQIRQYEDYRVIIAKKDVEIHKLQEQIVNQKRNDLT